MRVLTKQAVLAAAIVLLPLTASLARPAPKTPNKAVVIDERLSALRQEADTQAQVIRRLRAGRPLRILASKNGRDGQKFYRVVVTGRTRGWVHELAVAVLGRAGEDERVMKLIEATEDGPDRLALCQMFIEHFARSPLLPRVMTAMGEEADRAAGALSQRARRRLADAQVANHAVPPRILYLNDASLDRYSRLRVRFDFNEAANEYVYDGQAYRDLVRRFPSSEEAGRARQKLERLSVVLNRR